MLFRSFSASPKGQIKVDAGAKTALVKQGGSLLPSGIVGVENEFICGDPVSIVDAKGVELARGITNYSSSDIEKIKGAQSSAIEQLLGRKEYDAVVYRSNLVLV